MHADAPPGQAAEAARYAVLRRIGPALRHDLIVNLQAVGMMTEVAAARLDHAIPPLADLRQQLARIQRGTREAIANSLRVASWLAPPEDDSIGLREGVQECLALVRSGLEFRGHVLRSDLQAPPDFEVSSATLRPLLLAGLLYLADREAAPGELTVGAHLDTGLDTGQDAGYATLALSRSPAGSADRAGATHDADATYRPVHAGDVRALARDGRIDLQLEDRRVFIRLPRLMATSPLQIAPV
ncbi:MAG: hypothetical protein RL513_1895 [Pseudomonadota bacterium]|jgi:hypothetical protein